MVVHTCPKCEKVFNTTSNYQRHQKRIKPCIYKCPMCDKVLKSARTYNIHINETCPLLDKEEITTQEVPEVIEKKPTKNNKATNITTTNNNIDNSVNNTTNDNSITNNDNSVNDNRVYNNITLNININSDLPPEEVYEVIKNSGYLQILANLEAKATELIPERKKLIRITNKKSNMWEMDVNGNGELVPAHKDNVIDNIYKRRTKDVKECINENKGDKELYAGKKLLRHIEAEETPTFLDFTHYCWQYENISRDTNPYDIEDERIIDNLQERYSSYCEIYNKAKKALDKNRKSINNNILEHCMKTHKV